MKFEAEIEGHLHVVAVDRVVDRSGPDEPGVVPVHRQQPSHWSKLPEYGARMPAAPKGSVHVNTIRPDMQPFQYLGEEYRLVNVSRSHGSERQ